MVLMVHTRWTLTRKHTPLHLFFHIMDNKMPLLRLWCVMLAILAVLLNQAAAGPKKIPSYIPVCHRDSPDFEPCMLAAAESIRPRLAQGIPELRVPPLEPMVVPAVSLEQQGTRAVNFNCNLTNLEIVGLSSFQIVDRHAFRADVKDNKLIKVNVRFPHLKLRADYEIDGRILLVPLIGKGKFNGSLSDVIGTATMNGGMMEKKGVRYYENKDVHIKLNVPKAQLHFDNLFNGDKTLGPTTNKFINENSEEIVKEITPVVETVAAHIVQEMSNKIFLSFPYDQLFPV